MANNSSAFDYGGYNVTEPPTYADLGNISGNASLETDQAVGLLRNLVEVSSGNRELAGLAGMGVLMYGLYYNQAGASAWVAVLFPAVFVFNRVGLLPLGNGLVLVIFMVAAAFVAMAAGELFN